MSLFFKIFKPANPIHWNGRTVSEYSLLAKYKEFFFEYIYRSNFSKESAYRLLILIKETLINILIFIYLPISFLFYFFNYRFLWINTWQLGAYLQQIDSIVKENILDKNYKLIFLCPKFLLVNNSVHKLYKKKIRTIESFFVYLLFYPCMHTWFIKKTSWDFETVKKNNKFNFINYRFKKKFNKYQLFNSNFENELEIKKNIINKIGIKKFDKVIVVQQRDEFFYKSPNTRNSNIQNLNKALKYLIKKGYKIIRYKSMNSKSLSLNKKFYKELTIRDEKDKLEQFIMIKNCRLVICYQGGILGYDYICKTPFLLINALPININALIKQNDMVLLKKYFSIKLKKFLDISKVIKMNLHLYNDAHTLKRNDIKIIENNSSEIIMGVKEILGEQKFKSVSKTKKFFPEKFPFTYSDALICNSFIKKNPKIFIKN